MMTSIIRQNIKIWDIWDLQRKGWKILGIERNGDYLKVFVDLSLNKANTNKKQEGVKVL